MPVDMINTLYSLTEKEAGRLLAEKSAREHRKYTLYRLTPQEQDSLRPKKALVYEDFEYLAIGGGVVISKYTGRQETVVVPDFISGLPVVGIGKDAFFRCASVKSITLSNRITSIRECSFAHCKYLRSIDIPDSVISIGDSAFWGCAALTSIVIPNSVTSIGKYAFAFCRFLERIDIPDSVTSMGEEAFKRCEDLSINTKMGSCAYHYALEYRLKVEIFVDSPADYIYTVSADACPVVTIRKYIGTGDVVKIPKGIDNGLVCVIGKGSFRDNERLKRVVIPDGVVRIHANAFKNCRNLTEVFIPKSASFIAGNAFSGCKKLKIITERGAPALLRGLKCSLFRRIKITCGKN